MVQSGSVPLLPSKNPVTCLQKTPDPHGTSDALIGAITDIRVYRDGLLLARCKARGIAPARIFAGIDPLPYPVTTRLEIEFVSANSRETGHSRLPATVMQRSTSGIELRIGPGLASSASAQDHTR